MEPAIVVALLWALFGAIHIGLATTRIRGWMVSRLGDLGFGLVYSVIALATFALVVAYYGQHRYDGAPGLALGAIPAVRAILIAVVVLSIAMMVGAFANYRRSPYAVQHKGEVPPLFGLERVTRHPFFAGLVMFSFAHVLLATYLTGTAFMAGLGAVALVGMTHQDGKLSARYGAGFIRYLETSSAIPFAAIISGRQRIIWGELPVRQLAGGMALAIVLRAIHGGIFAYDGAPLIIATTATVTLILVRSLTRKRPAREHEATAASAHAHQPAR